MEENDQTTPTGVQRRRRKTKEIDIKFQFRTNDINMAKKYSEQTLGFKKRLKKMQKAKDMGFRFARLFQAAVVGKKNLKNCYLNPDKAFRRTWDTIMAIIILYATVITPVRVSIFYNEPVNWMDISGKIVDVFFVVDFVLNFFTAYYDKDVLINNKWAIAKKYCKGMMWLDFPTAIPMNILLPTGKHDVNSWFFSSLTRYPRALQWIRLIRLLRFYRVMKDIDTFVEIIIFRRVISRTTKKFIETGLVVLLLFHTLACLWYIVGVFNLSVSDNWVMRLGYLDRTKLEVYMACFHWTVQTIFTVGYGDFPARTKAEQLYSIFLQSIGQFIYAYIIGSISSIFNSMKKNSKEHDDTHVYIDNLVEKGKIKKSTYSKVKRQLNQDEKSIMEKVEAICENLRPHSTRKFKLHIYKNIYSHIKILKECTDEFLLILGANLKTTNYYETEMIYSPEDRARSIYFLSEGEVSLQFEKEDNNPALIVKAGEVFGEIEFFHNFDSRIVNAKPHKTDCKVFILDYNIATEIFERFDDFEATTFQTEAKKKFEKLKAAMNEEQRLIFKNQTNLSKTNLNTIEEADDRILGGSGGFNGNADKKRCIDKGSQTSDLDIVELLEIKKKYLKLKSRIG